ncbi:CoA transferase [Nocardiopsis nanhaiensis]
MNGSGPPAVTVLGDGPTADHARDLLAGLGAENLPDPGASRSRATSLDLSRAPSALRDWADSGAMALSGPREGPPVAAPGCPASAFRAALALFSLLTEMRTGARIGLSGARLLGERASLVGLARRGPWSCGGAFRALPTADGWWAISLPRAHDLELIPALVERRVHGDWDTLANWSRERTAAEASERAQTLGLAAAVVPAEPGAADDEQARHRRAHSGAASPLSLGAPGGPRPLGRHAPVVVDLTSLWAGPLCAHLLGLAGADIVKVESTRRPDGARGGSRDFYDLLHRGHASVALDLASEEGRSALRRLVAAADVVLEASRPRALRQMGIVAEEAVERGTIWTSITAYGRSGPWSNRVGFGDDVAAAAGLVSRDGPVPLPCGDALTDPLTGAHAAVATATALLGDRGRLIDVSMREVAVSAARGAAEPHDVRRSRDGWTVETAEATFPVERPRHRPPGPPAAPLGADTAATLTRLGAA